MDSENTGCDLELSKGGGDFIEYSDKSLACIRSREFLWLIDYQFVKKDNSMGFVSKSHFKCLVSLSF
jgi:hypothetical protein